MKKELENLGLPKKANYYSFQVDVTKRENVNEVATRVKNEIGKVGTYYYDTHWYKLPIEVVILVIITMTMTTLFNWISYSYCWYLFLLLD